MRITNEDIQQAIKEGFANGYEMAKAKYEKPQGKWKQISPAKIYECTNCGQTVMTGDIECYQFCPNCGADMRKEAKTEIADMRSITVKFTKIKELIDNWAVDDDEYILLERIANIVNEEEDNAE